jgi:hypothetical protein
MKSRKNTGVVIAALTGVVLLASGGWVAARQIKSPAQIAADTAPPTASLITAQVVRRSLSTEVIVRGTGRYGEPQVVGLPSSSLKTSTQLVSQIAKADDILQERSIAMTVSGRPVFILQGAKPMHRDIGPGDSGEDVRQLERALARFGYNPGPADGRYDGSTAVAVARMYRARGAAPFGLTEAQVDKLNTASEKVATAVDHMLQQRLTLRTAQRGATPADINQAEIDAAAVAELIPPARSAIDAARTKIAESRDLLAIAKRLEAEGDATARRDLAAAGVDVTTKQSALDDAITAQAEAQHALDALPPDATPTEVEAARSALRVAAAKIPGARAELESARTVYEAAANALRQSSEKARDDARKAQRDLALAKSDLRQAQRTLTTLQGKHRLAVSRVQILKQPASTLVERQIVDAASREVARSKAELSRLASRSGVQVPADEILFFPNTPVRVDKVTATRGSQVTGDLMTVSNTTLAIDAGLSPQDTKLVKVGLRVRIEDQETGIDLRGRVTSIADRPGTNPQISDPTKTAIEITPEGADKRLIGASVKLTIAIKSTQGKVLTVPLNALSVGADGRSRVQLDSGTGRPRLVFVNPGLVAEGNVEIEPKRRGSLNEGDRVVIGAASASVAAKGPTGSQAPATPAGVSSGQGGASAGSGSPPATTTPQAGAGAGSASTPAGGAAATPEAGGGAAATPDAGAAAGAPGGTRGP